MMKRSQTASLALLIGSMVLAPANVVYAQAQGTQQKTPGKQKGTAEAMLSGCLDQQEGRYVLVDDHGLQPVADLEAEGFPTEGFAKHLGHKVTLRGTSNLGGARPVFKVRNIETVSDTCAPASSTEKKITH